MNSHFPIAQSQAAQQAQAIGNAVPKPPSQVDVRLDKFHDLADRLDGIVSALEDRLFPVLLPPTPVGQQPAPGTAAVPAPELTCSLTDRIDGLGNHVGKSFFRLESILSRLAV